MAGIVSPIVDPIGSGASSTSTQFSNNDIQWDVAINGVPFLLDTSPDKPLNRKTVQLEREKLDSAPYSGGWSLGFWWQRQQNSFHSGSGQTFLDGFEPTSVYFSFDTDRMKAARFLRSRGIDPWTEGKVSLLKDTDKILTVASQSPHMIGGNDGTHDVLIVADGTTLTRYAAGSGTTVSWGGTGTILSLATDGTNYYAADATGVYKGTLAGGAGSLVWNTGSSQVVLGWVKSRLVGCIGQSLYELVGTGPALPSTPKFTVSESGWTWTDIAEGPNAIYACGYAGHHSAVYKFILDTSGGVPTLTTGITTAELPPGEKVLRMQSDMMSFMALGTSKGARVCDFSNDDIQTGSLSVEGEVRAFVGRGDFLYCGYNDPYYTDATGLARMDLGSSIGFRQYASANDLRANNYQNGVDAYVTGTVVDACLYGDLIAFLVAGQGVFVENATRLVSEGNLLCSRINYGTTKQKLFKRIGFRCEGTGGTVAVHAALNKEDFGSMLTTLDMATSTAADDVTITNRPADYVTLEFVLKPKVGDSTVGPTLLSYTLDSLPAVRRQREVQLPLKCYDFEEDRVGNRTGSPGFALSRIKSIEAAEDASNTVTVNYLSRTGEQVLSETVEVVNTAFYQQEKPTDDEYWGGTLVVTLRTV